MKTLLSKKEIIGLGIGNNIAEIIKEHKKQQQNRKDWTILFMIFWTAIWASIYLNNLL